MPPVSRAAARPSTLADTPEQALEHRIRDRIQKRLGSRIRDLSVDVSDKTIVLQGRCSTYYSKQLAQHAALGVIEDEQLENAIEVAIGR